MGRFPLVPTLPAAERALLVGVEGLQGSWPVDRSLDELSRLAATAGAEEVARLTQRLERPSPRTYIGSGKVEELCRLVHALSVDVVIFDDDLSPSQQANLERAVGEPVKIIDRTALILDIFGLHATTREGRLQVQLAQLQYLLPRLRGMWSHLAKEQTRGGIGSRFGQGETQLEVDRRLIRRRIATLKRELELLARRRGVQAKVRNDSAMFRIALAGYTNAGKSSLLNALTGAAVLAQDKLFATLDPTTRAFHLPGGRDVTITDTVGFIQKLPHGLVEAFKSTLAEARGADLIVVVVDASDDDCGRHIDAVMQVLREIGASSTPTLMVFNKIDQIDADAVRALSHRYPDAIFCSALTGLGIEGLVSRLSEEAARQDDLLELVMPYSEGTAISLLRRISRVIAEEYGERGVRLVVKIPHRYSARFANWRTDL